MTFLIYLLNTVSQVDSLTALGTAATLLSLYIFYITYFYPNYLSPLRHIPSPPTISKSNPYGLPFLGNTIDLVKEGAEVVRARWIDEFGGIVRYRELFGQESILLSDPKAIHQVLTKNSYDYIRPPRLARFLEPITGKENVFLAEGDVHKKLRKIIAPAFSHRNIKDMLPSIVGPCARLGEIWEKRASNPGSKEVEFDIMEDLSRATLDILGFAGFGHDFQSLTNSTSELGVSFENISVLDTPTRKVLRSLIPYYLNIPLKENRAMVHNLKVMERATTHMVDEKIAQARSIKSKGDARRDLLSVLICANKNSDVAQDRRLSYQELQDQVRIFMVAGHETTASAITWMLYALSINQDAQRRLRNELLQTFGRPCHSSSRPLTYDEINSLPFLNACVKELLRCYPPVASSSRVATKDDVILGFEIPKGTTVRLSLRAIQRLKSVWGEDAGIFKPERWLNPELVMKENPELAGRTTFVTPEMNEAYLPFLIGPRTCPGSKLALLELKILLYYLLINLDYSPSPQFKFVAKTVLAYRPDPGMRLTVKMCQRHQ
ncbi:hypothetical protein BGZ99_010363 [Dissophora globulifera]|uniref:Cytochrome P450 n=1 Tax=Dissophora globulifera TaxID=979702 RepID=A0A9P6R261_9FUNG|nr:hypothetical protein BGZ99_010363 [Dissophora globulifera]